MMFLLVFSDTSLASIAQTLYQAMAGHYTLLAIPFFILASTLHVDRRRGASGSSAFPSPASGICPAVWRLRASLPA